MGYMSLRLVYLLNYSMEQGPSFEGSEEIPFMGDIIPLCILSMVLIIQPNTAYKSCTVVVY